MDFEQLQEQNLQKNKELQEKTEKQTFLADLVGTALVEVKKFFVDMTNSITTAVKGTVKDVQKVQVTNPVSKIEVTNFPKQIEPKSEVSVKEAKEIIEAVKTLTKAVSDNKVTIPDVVFPKSFEVSNPQKEVSVVNLDLAKHLNKLSQELQKAIKDSNKSIKFNPIMPRIETKIDNAELLSAIQDLKSSLNIVMPETDLSGVVEASKATEKAIKDLRFPVPNFSSSWQHSLTMQSQDLPKHVEYKMVGSVKVQDYIQFVGFDGNTYKQTFTYDGDGDLTDTTGWVKQ